jgi:TRAP transporter TAXI family solute receptor
VLRHPLYKSLPKITATIVFLSLLTFNVNAEQSLFRIGTGGGGGTYFPIGTIIAKSLFKANIDRQATDDCQTELLPVAQRSNGSVSNINDISNGILEAGLVQADALQWAYEGSGPFEDYKPIQNIRGVASLYLESVHLVARTDANIKSVSDLQGKRVSLDEEGSGTLLAVLPILNAFQIDTDDMEAVYLKPSDTIERLNSGELDAFFIIAGYPIKPISDLVDNGIVTVIPIAGEPISTLLESYQYFSEHVIPADVYANKQAIPTLGVAAQLILSDTLPDDVAYCITADLWRVETMQALRTGHSKGHEVTLDSALTQMQIPLHPGARQFYVERGLLPSGPAK